MGIEPIYEVFRHADHTRVGLIQGLLEANGIRTMMRNRNAVSCTTEIPIPVMYPNICVFTQEDRLKAVDVLSNLENPDPSKPVSRWTCPRCGEENELPFTECWSCQEPMPDLDPKLQ